MTNTDINHELDLRNVNMPFTFGEVFESNQKGSKGQSRLCLNARLYTNKTEDDKSFVEMRATINPDDKQPSGMFRPVKYIEVTPL